MSHSNSRLASLLDMLRVFAKPFLEAQRLISQLLVAAQDKNIAGVDPKIIEHSLKVLDDLAEQVNALGLRTTAISVARLRGRVQGGGIPADWSVALQEVQSRLTDEIDSSCLLSLSTAESKLYEAAAPIFGNEVAAKFPSLAYDTQEVAKCMALGRSTAAAFHALRCLEAGFAAVWRCLGIADPLKGVERNWKNRLDKVEAKLEARWPASSGRMAGDAKLFDEIVGALKGMQNPYRNSTMHLDTVYPDEDAAHLVELVKGVLRKIASRMDEDGLQLVP